MSGNIYLPMHPASNSLLANYFPEFDPMMINVCMSLFLVVWSESPRRRQERPKFGLRILEKWMKTSKKLKVLVLVIKINCNSNVLRIRNWGSFFIKFKFLFIKVIHIQNSFLNKLMNNSSLPACLFPIPYSGVLEAATFNSLICFFCISK